MNGVLGFANLLPRNAARSEQREFAQTVQRTGDALLTIIDDVLDYSKIEAGCMTVEQIDFDLRSVCEEARGDSAGRGRETGTHHESRVRCDLAAIHQRRSRTPASSPAEFGEQTRSSSPKRGAVRIGVSRLDEAQLKISVADSGIGITPSS